MTTGRVLRPIALVAALLWVAVGAVPTVHAVAVRSCIYNAARHNSSVAPTTGSGVVGLSMSRSGNLLLLKNLATGAVGLRDRSTGAMSAMPATTGAHSGDFRYITTIDDGLVRVIDRRSGAATEIGTFTLGDHVQVHAVSDDGDTVLFSVAAPIDRQLRVFDVSERSTTNLTSLADGSFDGVSMSADGRRVLAVRSVVRATSELWLIDRQAASSVVIGALMGGLLSADGGTAIIHRVDGTFAVYDVNTATLSPLVVPGVEWLSAGVFDVSSNGRYVLLRGWPSGVPNPSGGWAPLVLDRLANATVPFLAFGQHSPFGIGVSDDGNHVLVSDDGVGGWAVPQPYVVDRGASTVIGLSGLLQFEREVRVSVFGTNLPSSPAGFVGPAGVSVGPVARVNALTSTVSFDVWSMTVAALRAPLRMTLTAPGGCRDTVPLGFVSVESHSGGMSRRVFHPGERTTVFADFAAVAAGPGLVFRKHSTPSGDFDVAVSASALVGSRSVTFTPVGSGPIAGGTLKLRSTSGEYHPVVPARLASRRVWKGYPLVVPVGGRGEVPTTGVAAVLLNVTATSATAASRLDVYPAGSAPPGRATASFDAGHPSSSMVAVRPGVGGAVVLAVGSGSAVVTAEVVGWVAAAGINDTLGLAIDPQPATRLYDSRRVTARKAAGSWTTLELPCIDCAGVVVNVTVVSPSADGELMVGGGGAEGAATAPLPFANLRYRAGQTVTNLAVVPSANGLISIGTTAAASFTLDIVGVLRSQAVPDGDVLRIVSPTAVADVSLPAASTRTVKVVGVAGVPSRATAVLVRLTSSAAASTGYVTAWRTGWTRPVASALTTVPGVAVSSVALVQLGADGTISVLGSAPSTLSVEVLGYTLAA